MKNLKSLVVILIVALTCTTLQAQKMAHIDTQKLIEAMPETKAAQTELERLRNSYDAELASMYKELEAKFKLYESEAGNKTEEENIKRAEELQASERKIAEYRQNAIVDLQKKEADLYSPLFDKARNAIKKVAADKGIQYVMDSTPGSGLIVSEGEDLLPAVKKQLGI